MARDVEVTNPIRRESLCHGRLTPGQAEVIHRGPNIAALAALPHDPPRVTALVFGVTHGIQMVGGIRTKTEEPGGTAARVCGILDYSPRGALVAALPDARVHPAFG